MVGFFIVCFLFIKCNHNHKKVSEGIITVTDFRNKEIKLDTPAQRIVCLIESVLSGIYMVGAENNVVGISTNIYNESVYYQYSLLDERIKNKKISAPGNWDFVNIENLIALQPDLVFIWASQIEAIQAIELKNIPVYAVMIKSTNDIYKEIYDIGKLTGKEKRADSLVNYTKTELKKIYKLVKKFQTEKKRIYYMWSQGPLETSGRNSTVNEFIQYAGAENVCTLPDEHLVVNFEKIIEWNPDIIIMWNNSMLDANDIINLPQWKEIKAIKEKKVFELPSVFLCDLWTLKFQYAVKLVAVWCYGNEIINIEEEKNIMLKKLYDAKGEFIK